MIQKLTKQSKQTKTQSHKLKKQKTKTKTNKNKNIFKRLNGSQVAKLKKSICLSCYCYEIHRVEAVDLINYNYT